jgi:excisionase family DNA binding protein
MIKRVYTVKEVSELLGCTINSVYTMIHQGTLRAVKVVSSYRIPVHELERYLNQDQRVETHNYTNERIQTPKFRRFT